MTARWAITAALLFCALTEARAEQAGYNVVLIFIDALRPDHLHCYGNPRKCSPALDALARESAVFEDNFATASYTLASFASINTSLYPGSHGLREPFKDKLPAPVKTLAGILGIYGYSSAWFGPLKDPHLEPSTGLLRGFERMFEGDFQDTRTARRKLFAWIAAHKEEKFFLNFHTYMVHSPYAPLLRYKRYFVKKEMPDVPDTRERLVRALQECDGHPNIPASARMTYRNLTEYFGYWRKLDLADPAHNAYVRSLYDACILEFDQEIVAPLVGMLKREGLYDRTVIVVCADHGEEFYEHGGYGHGCTLYDEAVRVPLIIRVPGMARGVRVRELSQNIDILPTVLGLLGIPVPFQAQGKDWSGWLRQGSGPPPRFYEYVRGQNSGKSYLRSKEWKYIGNSGGEPELYDLVLDPGEHDNLASRRPDILGEMGMVERVWEKGLAVYREREDSYPDDIDNETRERIRRTGYW